MRKFFSYVIIFAMLCPAIYAAPAGTALPPAVSSNIITAAPGQIDPYKTRSELLMDATAYTGVTTPEQAAEVWAKGLEMRSAALQYTVMTDRMKSKYAAQLDALSSNWVTGMSSPWVAGHTITGIDRTDDSRAVIDMKIETTTSADPPEYYNAKLWLVREDMFWRIDRVWADKALYNYTLYRP